MKVSIEREEVLDEGLGGEASGVVGQPRSEQCREVDARGPCCARQAVYQVEGCEVGLKPASGILPSFVWTSQLPVSKKTPVPWKVRDRSVMTVSEME